MSSRKKDSTTSETAAAAPDVEVLEDEEITANYRVIAYDLPRHGKSDPPENKEWWKE